MYPDGSGNTNDWGDDPRACGGEVQEWGGEPEPWGGETLAWGTDADRSVHNQDGPTP